VEKLLGFLLVVALVQYLLDSLRVLLEVRQRVDYPQLVEARTLARLELKPRWEQALPPLVRLALWASVVWRRKETQLNSGG